MARRPRGREAWPEDEGPQAWPDRHGPQVWPTDRTENLRSLHIVTLLIILLVDDHTIDQVYNVPHRPPHLP